MEKPTRIPPDEARTKMMRNSALLVCAYEGEKKIENNHLEGAISSESLKSGLDSLSKDREIIFYCA
jgi:hypothetical protein